MDQDVESDSMEPLFQAIVDNVKAPNADPEGGFQMQISQIDYNSYVGVIGIGRISRGRVKSTSRLLLLVLMARLVLVRLVRYWVHLGLARTEVASAQAGDIIAITGLGELKISDTICDNNAVEALPALSVDEPTVNMTFQVNTSPFCR